MQLQLSKNERLPGPTFFTQTSNARLEEQETRGKPTQHSPIKYLCGRGCALGNAPDPCRGRPRVTRHQDGHGAAPRSSGPASPRTNGRKVLEEPQHDPRVEDARNGPGDAQRQPLRGKRRPHTAARCRRARLAGSDTGSGEADLFPVSRQTRHPGELEERADALGRSIVWLARRGRWGARGPAVCLSPGKPVDV